MTQNPLLTESQEKYHAFPFQLLKIEHYVPAADHLIAKAKEQIELIKKNSESPSFINSVLALESVSERIGIFSGVFFNLLSAEAPEEMQKLAQEISPKLASFTSDILLDQELFARIRYVYDNRAKARLNLEQERLLEKTFKDFARNGALLNPEQKNRLRAIDERLSQLGPLFSEHNLKANNAFQMHLTKAEEVEGLPESTLEAAREAASEKKLDGWLLTLDAPSYIPFLRYAVREDLREKMWRAYNTLCFGGEFDNRAITLEIVQLRHERAQLLGFKTHADFVLAERMAESAERVTSFLTRLSEKSRPAAERDLSDVRALKKELTGQSEFFPWDYAFYAEKLKLRQYNLDEELLRPYFQLEKVIDGAFEHARRLYGLQFIPVQDVPMYHTDVKTYEVRQEDSGRFIGLFYADFFPRPTKRSGAWMTIYREQGLIAGKVGRPHVSIVCNFTKPTANKPSLLTLDEVRTLFHEFGHALHGLLSDVTYTSLAGVNVFWDFVELPSQVMENWVNEKESLDIFAHHYETGALIPAELVEKIRASSKFQAGWMSMRQIGFANLDMAWHSHDPHSITEVDKFEQEALRPMSLLPAIPGTCFSVGFSHIFAGGYSAGYYSYKWAEVLDADAFEFFKENGLFSREIGMRFREHVLSRGGTEHPMVLYKRFRGREPDPDALLRRDGLI